jgi:hypothetical protein
MKKNIMLILIIVPSWSWSYGSWIYNYLCNQYLSPLKLWSSSNPVNGEVYSKQHYMIKFVNDLRHVTGRWFSPVSSTNKTDRHDITEILLKVALNIININQTYRHWRCDFESHPGEVYSIQHYVIKLVSDLRQLSGFLRVLGWMSDCCLTPIQQLFSYIMARTS